MKTKPKQITQWSFSRLKDYRACPAKAKYKHVDRLKEPHSEVLDRGSRIHKLAEEFSQATAKKLPPDELIKFVKEFRVLQKQNLTCEERWALNRDWEPTGFFAEDTWLRLVLDCAYVLKKVVYIIDYKTGKKYEDHKEQLSLYALAAFCYYPLLESAQCAMWYVDSGEKLEVEFKRSELDKLKEHWTKESKPMLSDKRFAPMPGRHCAWCSFSKSKGGPCKF